MESLIIFIYILVSIVLIALILLQQSKGSDIGSAFGGGSSNTMFGPSSSLNPLTKVTAFLSAVFLILSLGITYQARVSNNEILFEESPEVIDSGILPEESDN
tara:strand:- start:78782 stop:79087 length:306 start_codon:yes stop_codon:yes gene_type:complete